jgi:nicotinamide-nucleotide amidase
VSDESLRAGNRKQALVPRGAAVLEPVGTAPGLVVPGEPLVLVLPGPPRELQPMWEAALSVPVLEELLAGGSGLETRIIRMTGLPESELARTLRGLSVDGALEVTTCLRRGELEVATTFPASAGGAYEDFEAALLERHGDRVFSRDGSTVDEIVAGLLLGPPVRTIAVAESCTGGLMAGRLTDRAGSSEYVLGGVVVYSNEAKVRFADVPVELIERFGAVSPEVAVALADGAIARFGAELGIGITGVAGPGGGSPEKPVGMVCISVAHADGEREDRTVQLPGDRAMVRERTTTVAMHLLRRLLLRLAA